MSSGDQCRCHDNLNNKLHAKKSEPRKELIHIRTKRSSKYVFVINVETGGPQWHESHFQDSTGFFPDTPVLRGSPWSDSIRSLPLQLPSRLSSPALGDPRPCRLPSSARPHPPSLRQTGFMDYAVSPVSAKWMLRNKDVQEIRSGFH